MTACRRARELRRLRITSSQSVVTSSCTTQIYLTVWLPAPLPRSLSSLEPSTLAQLSAVRFLKFHWGASQTRPAPMVDINKAEARLNLFSTTIDVTQQHALTASWNRASAAKATISLDFAVPKASPECSASYPGDKYVEAHKAFVCSRQALVRISRVGANIIVKSFVRRYRYTKEVKLYVTFPFFPTCSCPW